MNKSLFNEVPRFSVAGNCFLLDVFVITCYDEYVLSIDCPPQSVGRAFLLFFSRSSDDHEYPGDDQHRWP